VVPLDLFSERIIAVSAIGNVAMGGVLLGVSVSRLWPWPHFSREERPKNS
jgi:hypothetical protein